MIIFWHTDLNLIKYSFFLSKCIYLLNIFKFLLFFKQLHSHRLEENNSNSIVSSKQFSKCQSPNFGENILFSVSFCRILRLLASRIVVQIPNPRQYFAILLIILRIHLQNKFNFILFLCLMFSRLLSSSHRKFINLGQIQCPLFYSTSAGHLSSTILGVAEQRTSYVLGNLGN